MQHQLQDILLEKIVSRFQKKVDAVEALSELLGTGKDAIYRRLRGDTLLTPDELTKLATTYNISLDGLVFEKSDTVFFSFNSFTKPVRSFSDYLEGVQGNFSHVMHLPRVKLYYSSAGIPIFHYCFFKELIAFKLYTWGKTIWDLDSLKGKQFSWDILPFPLLKTTEEILQSYTQLNSLELWSLNIIDTTLNQIEYAVISGDFADEADALTLCDKLIELTHHQQAMAEHGKKFSLNGSPENGSNLDLFHNELVYTNNTLYIKSDSIRAVFSTFSDPNFISSTDSRMCDYVDSWFQRIISKSDPISVGSEKTRNWFFNGLRRKINNSKTRIQHQIELMA